MATESTEHAFVLHCRAYRETSLLVDLLTAEEGLVRVVARGAKRPKSPLRGILQPFIALQISCGGKSDLKTLYRAETSRDGGPHAMLKSMALWCGLYVNELLLCTLPPHDPHPRLFHLYAETLVALASTGDYAVSLRRFEKHLLRELGYDLNLRSREDGLDSICADSYYHYLPEQGLCEATGAVQRRGDPGIFAGKSLLAVRDEQWQAEHWRDKQVLADAKRLLRLALSPVLRRPLNSPRMLSY